MRTNSKLNHITFLLARKALSKPGMIVECVKECTGLVVGKCYEVAPELSCGRDLGIKFENEQADAWLANRFKKRYEFI